MEHLSGQADQAKRVVYMLIGLQNGARFTTKELCEIFLKLGQTVSLRTIQRDLRLLQDSVNGLECRKEGKEVIWSIPKNLRSMNSIVRIDSHELLSFYVLKAHLRTFAGTSIAKDIDELTDKLEELAPGQAYSEESLYWDQNVGQYDYSQSAEILNKVIKSIVEEKWVSIKYKSSKLGTEKIYDVLFRKLFTYYGMLYISTYIPKHKSHVALTLQGIVEINDSSDQNYKAPKFNFKEFTRIRFGVFTKDLRKVKLRINRHYVHYFQNRQWHQSQRQTIDPETGDMIMELYVPLGPDFISWILSWHDAIKVIKPVELIDKVKARLRATLYSYTK